MNDWLTMNRRMRMKMGFGSVWILTWDKGCFWQLFGRTCAIGSHHLGYQPHSWSWTQISALFAFFGSSFWASVCDSITQKQTQLVTYYFSHHQQKKKKNKIKIREGNNNMNWPHQKRRENHLPICLISSHTTSRKKVDSSIWFSSNRKKGQKQSNKKWHNNIKP